MPAEPQDGTFESSAESMLTPTARVIDGICVQGYKIRDCFALYVHHFAFI